ncbi:MAG: cysteine--tRNA ligase [Candidatus Magasanikbacteria bacterium]|nr:cysteine--tRNA ligase [Candidatus Magasanikbacteria bacterium]
MLKLYNSLTRKKESFKPLHGKKVGMYTCGPTVYNYAHIGNLRTYVFEDILKRTLKQEGYDVYHVMNITDVGHLSDDADNGEDKMEKGSKREGQSAWDIAAKYTEAFKQDLSRLNILEPSLWCKATDHIPEQIEMVRKLTEKGISYETEDGIYFDSSKIPDYGKLAGLQTQELKPGARVSLGSKKNLHDFALWKFSKPEEKRQMEWEAFGKMGFPGWHIECSAMSVKYLGEQFDIHCGGIDHIPVHHSNEIAQTEATTGIKPWVQYWLHGEFLSFGDKEKMAKSGDNFITLERIIKRDISALSYRYFLLQAHYRKQIAFSWKALEAAEQGLKHLRSRIAEISEQEPGDPHVIQEFFGAIRDDLNTAEALAVLQNALKQKTVSLAMISAFDKILALELRTFPGRPLHIPHEVQELLKQRQKAREGKNFQTSDTLRDDIHSLGFLVEDTPEGQKISRIEK